MQTLLNFHIETTKEKRTPGTGMAIFSEYLKGLNFENLCRQQIPNSLHHKAYGSF